MRIADVLRNKGAAVATIAPETPVSQLLAALAGMNVGALVVVGPEGVVGIVSERDVVRRLHERGSSMLHQPVSEIMTTVVVTCTPRDTVDHLAALMGINVAGHWRPTSANYFDRVSKQALLAHVSEVGGPTMAASFMGSKKGDLSASCERLFAGETIVAPEVKEAALAWVPDHMRFRVIATGEAAREGGVEPKNAAVVEVSDEPSGEGAPEHVGEDELSNDAVDEPELLDA